MVLIGVFAFDHSTWLASGALAELKSTAATERRGLRAATLSSTNLPVDRSATEVATALVERGVSVVLHCGRSRTPRQRAAQSQLLHGCVLARVHFVDASASPELLGDAWRLSRRARDVGVMLIPVGVDLSTCAAARVARLLDAGPSEKLRSLHVGFHASSGAPPWLWDAALGRAAEAARRHGRNAGAVVESGRMRRVPLSRGGRSIPTLAEFGSERGTRASAGPGADVIALALGEEARADDVAVWWSTRPRADVCARVFWWLWSLLTAIAATRLIGLVVHPQRLLGPALRCRMRLARGPLFASARRCFSEEVAVWCVGESSSGAHATAVLRVASMETLHCCAAVEAAARVASSAAEQSAHAGFALPVDAFGEDWVEDFGVGLRWESYVE